MAEETQETAFEPRKAVPDGMRAVTKFTAEDAHEVGLPSPAAINYMMSIANMLSNTALVGKDMGLSKDQIGRYRGDMGLSGEQIMELEEKAVKNNAMAKMLVGREFNPPMPPMAALQEIDIVKNKIFIRYPHLIAQMEARGYVVDQIERTHERAALSVTKPGQTPQVFEFTFEDAKRAGLTGPDTQYAKRPRVMLWARCVSEAYRATGGRGRVYTPEEKQEILNDKGDTDEPDRGGHAEENPYVLKKPAEKSAPEPVKEADPVKPEPVKPEPVKEPAVEPQTTGPRGTQGVLIPEVIPPPPKITEAPKPAPVVAPGGPETLRERVERLRQNHSPDSSEAAWKDKTSKFFRACLKVQKLPTKPEEFGIAPWALEGSCSISTESFLKSPDFAGMIANTIWVKIKEMFKGRPDKLVDEIVISTWMLSGTEDPAEPLEYWATKKFDNAPDSEIYAYLLLLGFSRDAYKVRKASLLTGRTVDSYVALIQENLSPLPISKAKREELEKAIDLAVTGWLDKKQDAQPAPGAAPAAPAEEDEGSAY